MYCGHKWKCGDDEDFLWLNLAVDSQVIPAAKRHFVKFRSEHFEFYLL